MRYLFVSAQLAGHLDWGGYLRTAGELARRGHVVIWASARDVAPLVGRAGVPFHALEETGWRWPPPPPLPATLDEGAQALMQMRQIRALDQWLDIERVESASTELVALARDFRPELIVSEMFTSAAGLTAEIVGVPFAVAGWPAPAPSTNQDEMVQIARQRLERLTSRFRIKGVNWTPSGPPALLSPLLHLTYWSHSWFAGVKMRSQTRHVGGQKSGKPAELPESDPLPSPDHMPWVLITLGTSFNQDPNFFVTASVAAEQAGCLPLIALGASKDEPWVQEMLPRLPHRAIVRSRFDFDVTLPSVASAIHHGGAGTTHALVTHAVPQIVVPHAADQMRQAQGVMRSGVGFAIPPSKATVENLVKGLVTVLPDLSPIRAKARLLQAEFESLGGIQTAADLLEDLMGTAI